MKNKYRNKKTFSEFLSIIYGMTYDAYDVLTEVQKKAIEIDYINRYGSPIVWF